jgi:hypothetical protein
VIVADCEESHTGAYMLYAQRTNNPAGAAIVYFGGQPQPGLISSAAQNNTYTFRGSANAVVNFTMVTTSGSVVPKLRVYNPDGSLLAVTFSGAGYG